MSFQSLAFLAFLALNVILLTGKVRFSLKGKPVGRLLLLLGCDVNDEICDMLLEMYP